ncbi:uncharacterized protein F4812DRAFT_444327 [Daldinia caldariorum]|uniref:uncharacterized protein n=1 Tax=Daldinia caldariorum TaxID=326644 RepID=UPI0020087C6D|nr:uncharacterized protein F4812DRAFT_444327 [Daldinia caldariorum]KAI1464044.1 hypothetical protein F4812DRAFT_444327 [Daldinia caldariorum]
MTDSRPESSPYAGPHTTLRCADGLPFSVPTSLVNKFFWLNLPGLTHYFINVPSDCGHVIVHYLFTGTYQCLKPEGASQQDRDIAEFTTCARVYKIAGDYLLFGLRNLTRDEMERLARRLQVTQLLDVMKDVHPTIKDTDIWLRHFLKSLVERLIDNPWIPILYESSQRLGNNTSIASVLVGTSIELCRAKLLTSQQNPPTVASFHDYICGTQDRGTEHLEGMLGLNFDPQKDKSAKEKQGDLGENGSATGSNPSAVLTDGNSKLTEEKGQQSQQTKGSSEASVKSSSNINLPKISLVGVEASDLDSESDITTPASAASGESNFCALNSVNGTG